jgi:hypothetical protein
LKVVEQGRKRRKRKRSRNRGSRRDRGRCRRMMNGGRRRERRRSRKNSKTSYSQEIKWKILNQEIRTNNDWKKFMSQQNEGILIKRTTLNS